MGNLGAYQLIVTLAKKVGRPKNLALIVATGGYAAGKGIELVAKRAVRRVKGARNASDVSSTPLEDVFTALTGGDAGAGLALRLGDHFRVLSKDDDSIQIEVLGNVNNPYFVSRELLRSISDFANEIDSRSEN